MNISLFEDIDSKRKITIRYRADYSCVLDGQIILEDENKVRVHADEKEMYDMLKMYFDELSGEQHG